MQRNARNVNKMKIIDRLNDKRILIFGYGREGKSTENFIKKHCTYKSLDVFEGKKEDIQEDNYDLIIKSPGIVMFEDNEKYTSQTELFLDEFGKQCVGITGTKGKSTTSSMLAHALNYCGKKAILLGNIGKPCFDHIDDIYEETVVVFELSCHQLLHINTAPHIAVFLNLFEEHLDYYGTFDRYFKAKANIISHQNAGDLAFVGENVPHIQTNSTIQVINAVKEDFNLSILGDHNRLNAQFVCDIAVSVFGQDKNRVIEGINEFKGLPHRLEFFADVDGIKYYDDSISTIPEALISASQSIPAAKTFIFGGMDRGIDYSLLVDFINERHDLNFIAAYATGKRIFDSCEKREGLFLVENLDEAVLKAKEVTMSGEAVVLSPAAPSYGYFKNFEERGEYFKSIV